MASQYNYFWHFAHIGAPDASAPLSALGNGVPFAQADIENPTLFTVAAYRSCFEEAQALYRAEEAFLKANQKYNDAWSAWMKAADKAEKAQSAWAAAADAYASAEQHLARLLELDAQGMEIPREIIENARINAARAKAAADKAEAAYAKAKGTQKTTSDAYHNAATALRAARARSLAAKKAYDDCIKSITK